MKVSSRMAGYMIRIKMVCSNLNFWVFHRVYQYPVGEAEYLIDLDMAKDQINPVSRIFAQRMNETCSWVYFYPSNYK